MGSRNDIPASALRPIERPLSDTTWPRGQCTECGCADRLLYVGRSGKVDACERCYWEHAYEKAYADVERVRAAFRTYIELVGGSDHHPDDCENPETCCQCRAGAIADSVLR